MALLILGAAAAGWIYGAPAFGPDVADGSQLGAVVNPAEPVQGSAGGPVDEAELGPDDGAGEAADPAGGPDEEDFADEALLSQLDDPVAQQSPQGRTDGPSERTSLIVNHQVAAGETLWDIARAYGTDVTSIARSNALSDRDVIRAGQVLVVPTVKGVVHSVGRGETLWDIGRLYGVAPQKIAEVNALADPDRLAPGDLLVIPGVDGPLLDRVVVGGRLQRVFSWPVRGRVSSGYGWRWGRLHEGVDLAVPAGTPVRAAAPGRVVFAGWGGGYGYLISIDHGSRVITRYAHNSRIVVRQGQWVRRGQVVAYSGDTGNSTGPHVHFEIRYRGRAVNPLPYLR